MAWEGYRHPCPEGENCPSYSITRDFGKGGTDIDFMRQKGDTMWFIEEKHVTENSHGDIPFLWKDIPPAGRLEILQDPKWIAYTSNYGCTRNSSGGWKLSGTGLYESRILEKDDPLPDDYEEGSDKYELFSWGDCQYGQGRRTLQIFDKEKILTEWLKWCDKHPDTASVTLMSARHISTGQLTALCNLAVALGEKHYVYLTFYDKMTIPRPSDMSKEIYEICKADMTKHMFWVHRLRTDEESLYKHFPVKKYYPATSRTDGKHRDFTFLTPSFTFESIEDYQKWRDNLGMDD